MNLRVLLPFAAVYYVSYLLRTVNAVIAPELVSELGLGAAQLGFLTSTYFLAFAVAQLPVGVALDRFGARRVVSALVAVAMVGSLLFSVGHDFATLALGRGLTGLGVSACLMGAFQAFAAAFPAARQASLTGLVMAAGATGALTASVPLDWALPVLGWRGSLALAAGACAIGAAFVHFVVPRRLDRTHSDESASVQARAMLAVMRSPHFWRFAPQAALFTGGFMALQGLWAVPWLMTVEDLSRTQAALVLLALNLGMLGGQLSVLVGATRLQEAGLPRGSIMTVGLALAVVIEALIVARIAAGPLPWFALGFFAALGAQVYGVTASHFPPALTGRVSAAVNQLAFIGAFVIQWGVGLALEALARRGLRPIAAFQMTFGALAIAKAAVVLWSARASR